MRLQRHRNDGAGLELVFDCRSNCANPENAKAPVGNRGLASINTNEC
jgi:hypothetical protein